MARMGLIDCEELGGVSVSVDAFAGGDIAALNRLLVPRRGEQVSGDHLRAMVQLLYSMFEVYGNAAGGFIYRDSTDTNLQYSVSATDIHLGAALRTYAGAVNLGPLSAGATNYIWLDLSAEPMAIGQNTTGWPDYPHLKLATIAAPASGAWKPSNLTRYMRRQAASPLAGVGQIWPIAKEFVYNTSSPVLLGKAPAGARVYQSELRIDTTFNGSPALTIGDSGSNNRLMASGDNTPGTAGGYTKNSGYKYTSATDINLYITQGGASQGAGWAGVLLVL
ncbi:MAG: hypothetical protein U1A27_00030 [Phycisphaerae bacterium]